MGPHDGISALIRDTRELVFSLCLVRAQKARKTILTRIQQTRKRVLSRTQPCWYPDLVLTASRTVRKQMSVV